MSSQFIVIRDSYHSASIYIECEACWMSHIDEPNRTSTHCIDLDEARGLADQMDEENVGARSQERDCAHAKTESSG